MAQQRGELARHCSTLLVCTALIVCGGCALHASDRELFQQAVGAGKAADADTRWYIFSEIAKAQAKHGYYDDAMQSLNLTDKYPDQLFIELVSIRAKNGDVSGAKAMAEAVTSEVRWRATEAIAVAQAESGNVSDARETLAPLPPRFQQSPLEAIGTYQAEAGDLESALRDEPATSGPGTATSSCLSSRTSSWNGEKRSEHTTSHRSLPIQRWLGVLRSSLQTVLRKKSTLATKHWNA